MSGTGFFELAQAAAQAVTETGSGQLMLAGIAILAPCVLPDPSAYHKSATTWCEHEQFFGSAMPVWRNSMKRLASAFMVSSWRCHLFGCPI